MNEPFCADCQHKYRPTGVAGVLARWRLWEDQLCCRPSLPRNLVTGETKHSDFCSCQRTEADQCGREGKFFVPIAVHKAQQEAP